MLTELNIINEMLAATGTTPVSASDTRHPSYVKASNKLAVVSAAVQNLGYWFNTTYPTLALGENGEITVPSGTLSVDATDRKINVSKRGTRLYNLSTRNFVFTKAVEVKLIQELDFVDMPDTVKQYMRDKARFEFYLDEDGTEPKLSNYRSAVNLSWGMLYREHLRNRDTNYFDGPNAANSMARGRSRSRLPGPQE